MVAKTLATNDYDAFTSINATYPTLHYIGNLDLLKRPKVAIIGSRRPNTYTKNYTYKLANLLCQVGVCVVSGTAMGVDALAHNGAGEKNTIAVVANGLDLRTPSVNAPMIKRIEQEGLMLSSYPLGAQARPYTFVQRNEIIAAMSDVVVVAQADLKSGSLHTAKFALKHQRPLFVLPHRLGESEGTWSLLHDKKAQSIDDLEAFVKSFGTHAPLNNQDDFLAFCAKSPPYDQALKIYGAKVYEAELSGQITVREGQIYVC